MPEVDERLDDRLDAARRELLGEIRVPLLGDIQARAGRIRSRRRRVAAAFTTASLVLAAAAYGVTSHPARTERNVPAAGGASVWSGGGLRLLGLSSDAVDLPGALHDIEFADPLDGYALAAACTGTCRITLARTTDGGRSWATVQTPVGSVAAGTIPALLAIGDSQLALAAPGLGQTVWISTGNGWRVMSREGETATVPSGARLWLDGAAPLGPCTARPVLVLTATGFIRTLARQPAMTVCQVATAPTADGAWWVSGHVNASGATVPALAVSRDQGRSWTVTSLPAVGGHPDAWVQVSTVGSEVYAAVVSADGHPDALQLHAVYRSLGRGAFVTYVAVPATTIAGDLVPLLDGRLVLAGPQWMICDGSGEMFQPAGGSLPSVAALRRTPGVWVAYDLFGSGWSAVSEDGKTWQKINVR